MFASGKRSKHKKNRFKTVLEALAEQKFKNI